MSPIVLLFHHLHPYCIAQKKKTKWNNHLNVEYKANVLIQTKFGRIKIDILLTYDFVNNATVITNNGELSTLVQHQLGKNQN